MSELAEIQVFAQQVAESVSSVLQVEVAIIDKSLRLCVGTGLYLNKRDMVFDSNSASGFVIKQGQPVFIRSPRKDAMCQNCGQRFDCPDQASLCYPIIASGETVGLVGLVALTRKQRQSLLENEQKFIEFLSKLAGLIGLCVKASTKTTQLPGLVEQLEAVVNSISEGLLYLNRKGEIQYANNCAATLLHRTREDLIGKLFDQIFPDNLQISKVLTNAVPVQKGFALGNGSNYYGTITPLITNPQDPGLVVSFKGVSTVQKTAQNTGNDKERQIITFENIYGISDSLMRVKQKAMQIARGDSSVVIFGESGTGKELFAQAIHSASLRNSSPFIAINCGAIPESLLESELFGYEEGAFSGARKGGKPGRFEMADHGTLFLDEIGDMPLHLQVKLLRVLEERQIDHLGGTMPISFNVRLIAGTNKDLDLLVKKGEFREDLFYRLHVIPLSIPPLRERGEDIQVYLNLFLSKYNFLLKKSIQQFSVNALKALLAYSWPGNVRELQNVVEYAVNMASTTSIEIANLPEKLLEGEASTNGATSIAEAEKRLIKEALIRFGTDTDAKNNAAQYLGISLSTLYRKLKRYNISE